jgi:hypothetical protein
MKNSILILFSIFFLTSVVFAQVPAKKPNENSTDPHLKKTETNTQTHSEPKITDDILLKSNGPVDKIISKDPVNDTTKVISKENTTTTETYSKKDSVAVTQVETNVPLNKVGAKRPVMDATTHSKKPKANNDNYSEPMNVDETLVKSNIPVDRGVQFSLAGLLLGSLGNWNDLKTDESKLGFGFGGDLYAGIILDDMYVGVGPHFGYNFWSFSKSISGITASSTTSIGDFGFGLGAAWEGFYLTLGMGSGNVSVTAEADGDSQTIDLPEGIAYTRIGLGWFDGFAIGIALMNYSDDKIPNELNRVEFNLGWAF